MEKMSRREFVAAATAVVAACGACATCTFAADAAGPEEKQVDIGVLSDYPKDGVYDKFAKSHQVFVIRNEGELYACSAVCTHKKAALTYNGKEIVCKKHGSKFSEHGTATKGPAKNSLPRYAIAEGANKHLIVDTTKSFSEKEWQKDGAFVKVA